MAEAVVARPAVTPEIVELEPLHAAVEHVGGAAADVPSLLGGAFTLTMGEIQASGAQVAGPPFARYLSFGERIEAEVGFPYIGTLVPTERVRDTVLPGGRAVLTTHVGSYEDIGAVWEAIGAWIQEHGLEVASPPWESYLSGPDDPGLPVTRIVFPIR